VHPHPGCGIQRRVVASPDRTLISVDRWTDAAWPASSLASAARHATAAISPATSAVSAADRLPQSWAESAGQAGSASVRYRCRQ